LGTVRASGTPGDPCGGILNRGTLSMTDVNVTGNRAGKGGSGNFAPGSSGGSGGGIFNTSTGRLTLTRCTVSGNRSGEGGLGGFASGGDGGGILNTGTLIIIDSTISDNQASSGGGGGGKPGGNGGSGGGIYTIGTATLVNTTISGNRSGDGAGGLFNANGVPGAGGGIANFGVLTLSSSTISGNETGAGGISYGPDGHGGGIYHSAGQVTISNSTITANRIRTNYTEGNHGGGIYRYYSGTVTLRSTIVAGNFQGGDGSDIAGTVQSDGYNLIGDPSGTNISPNPGAGPEIYGAANLNVLADNGGPTQTHLPRSDSPAIDKGKNFSASSTDQRGFARTMDLTDARYPNAADGTDIGAVELAPVVARNISTRAKIEAGENVLIAGFIVTGTLPKKVVLRGLGPSLHDANVPGVLDDPELELRASNGALMRSNDNWQDDPAQVGEIQAAGLAPTRAQESAILLTLVPSSYTVIVRGKSATTGVGLVEVYDIGNASSELANVSGRSLVHSGDNVMIGGFTLGPGDGNPNLILRALGPSLASLGISNALADPTLDLRDANGNQIGFNDNWQDDSVSAAQVSAKGLAPTRDNESAISLTFIPGQYTAIVHGKNNGTGVGLIEIYNTH
jgi:hypothetical protein